MTKLRLIILVLITSCSSNKIDITGNYKSTASTIDSFFNNYPTGSTIKINIDKSFEREDCAQITKGHWRVKGDSLYLYCDEIRFIIDSLNNNPKYKKGTICGTKPDVFYIDKNVLKRTQINKDGSKLKDYLKKQ
ncbi:hypothetical protein [Flavobacterium sp. AG291]|uniref:hypothetical protein n=1 Tax=Flavobacterium sp. AG291 TaxID=2184000 RepID=UPI000E0C101F|nr:hypothetical protein [Flavobacterium sp. AG291]RDI12138.1 hypothetical protein DEU42_10470 [Flavobacterium sp. AG291]